MRPPVALTRSARITVALFFAGFATFSLLWCVQPLLPFFARSFGLDASTSALALSASTAPLAGAILVMGAVSESLGRKRLMAGALLLASALNLACALAPSWAAVVILRGLEGLALGGAPAVAMAYLAEELPYERIGSAMGLYVAGNATGGMFGRILAGGLTDIMGWRGALAVVGAVGLGSALLFAWLLPPSQNFRPRRGGRRLHFAAWKRHLTDPTLARLYVLAFLVMGAFVSTYNYVGFHLSEPPYGLAPRWVGLLFLVYVFGVLASSAAGKVADRAGRKKTAVGGLLVMGLGLGLTLLPQLAWVVLGVALLTFGFFTAHAVASGWVGVSARGAKGHASALYLCAYYLGSSGVGWLGGFAWHGGGWRGSVGFGLAIVAISVVVTATTAEDGGRRSARG